MGIREAIKQAKAVIEKISRLAWPKDDWVSIGADWDLNLTIQNFQYKAVLYPVRNGEADTSTWHEVSYARKV